MLNLRFVASRGLRKGQHALFWTDQNVMITNWDYYEFLLFLLQLFVICKYDGSRDVVITTDNGCNGS